MKNQRGNGTFLAFLFLVALAFALTIIATPTPRQIHQKDLKTYFSLTHDPVPYTPDEAALLRPMVESRLRELENNLQKAKDNVFSQENSQALLSEYQTARDSLKKARDTAIYYDLIPNPPQNR
jgi:hypothetical protein